MRHAMSFRRPLSLAAAMGAFLVVGPAVASAATTTCSAPALSQVYSWAQDTYWYAAVPGEKWDSMTTTGWTLSGGAKLVTTTLADGAKGNVLYLPSGSKAISPAVCVTNSYPAPRTEIKDVTGSAGVSIA